MSRKIATRRSPIHGNGMFAVAPIAKGERLIEYKGRRRTHAEVDEGDSGDIESGHTFLFTLNDDYVIDANFDGNDARWINHSCDPNCEAVLEEDDGDDRRKDKVFIESIRKIKPGEELSYNYGIRLEEKHTKELKKIWECRCGSPNCTGTMLQPKSEKKIRKRARKIEKGRREAEAGAKTAGLKQDGVSKKAGTTKKAGTAKKPGTAKKAQKTGAAKKPGTAKKAGAPKKVGTKAVRKA